VWYDTPGSVIALRDTGNIISELARTITKEKIELQFFLEIESKILQVVFNCS
jgi:hypothetical protein